MKKSIIVNNAKTMKTGIDYVTVKIPKKTFTKLPDGYFYIDLEITNVRGGKKE